MTPERWQQVKGALAAALECDETRERAAVLRRACAGDTSLRREVESLLDQPPDEFDSFAETFGLVNSDAFLSANIGRRIGAYELVHELGRGGMGTVWLGKRADQQFEKLVAVKLLKRGTDTDEVLRRFRAERQILARLEHPNIARLLDGGMTEDALPYFVMEYVEGEPVTEFCQAHALSVEQRLRLFLKVCGAVQFAHQNLVIHRDLKPGNILVTEDGEPKLLDFGISKLIAQGDDGLVVTINEHQRLTPAYASPEQVRGEPVTTVTDIYTLGTLLFEILTGQSAHRFGTMNPPPTELLRVVAQEEPLRPSTAAPDPMVKRALRGDLDTVILKALRKEPARRYASVGSLSEDIRRHLEDRPVRARKDTAGYRAAKFYRRNKLTVAAGAIVLLTLIAGIVATAYQARAERKQRARAEHRFNDVRKIANSLMLELHNAIKDLPGAMAARQLVTQHALEYLDSLALESGSDLSLKSELATAYEKIGLVTFGVQDAIRSHRKATALNEELVEADPKNLAYRKQLSESCKNLSDVLKIGGNSTHSIEYARKSLALTQSLVAENPGEKALQIDLADRHLSLGFALIDAGHFKEALQSDLQAMAIQQAVLARDPSDGEASRELAAIYGAISSAYEDAGEVEKALDYNRKSLAERRDRFDDVETNARSRRSLWARLSLTARERALAGDAAGALENYTRAVPLMEGLAAADPQDEGHRRWLALSYLAVGESFARLGQPDEALEH
ncbi:MAG: protein kinase [Verrucomicrobiota bacterium]|nr:protein kinase [Verrucomicrobiota bacterium]